MRNINAEKWSPEWFELTTTDELMDLLHESRIAITRVECKDQGLCAIRIRKLEEQLHCREIERDAWQEDSAPRSH